MKFNYGSERDIEMKQTMIRGKKEMKYKGRRVEAQRKRRRLKMTEVARIPLASG